MTVVKRLTDPEIDSETGAGTATDDLFPFFDISEGDDGKWNKLTRAELALALIAAGLAPLASPALTGNPTAPTQSPGNTSTRLATTQFVADAIAAAIASTFIFKGSWDASSGSFPGAGAAQTGWFYKVSVAGTVDGVTFGVGDDIFAITDNASTSTYAANWLKVEGVVTDAELSTSDITTNNVSSSKHGFAPKSPADATKFLNGAATPDYAAVKDSDLSTSDVTDNNVSTSKHGFAPKLPNDATKYMDGTGVYSVPAGGGSMHAGVVLLYAGASAPSGYLFCYGQAVSRSTYSDLFTAISTTHGVGDGSTTFNVPDLRGRVAAGKDDMGGSAASRLTNSGTGNPGIDGTSLGAAGGADRHTLTTAQMPTHSHNIITGFGGSPNSSAVSVDSALNNITSRAGIVENAGSGNAHPIVQPTIVLNYIIKT